MAIFLNGVSTNGLVKLSGVDLTSMVRSVVISQNYDKVEVTAMGATSKAYIPGLSDDTVTIEFMQNFGATSTDATISPLLGSTTGATLLIQTSSATVSATQPSYTMLANAYTYEPLNGAVGALSTTSVAFAPAAGSKITKATS